MQACASARTLLGLEGHVDVRCRTLHMRLNHRAAVWYRTVRNLDRYFGRSHLSDVPGAGTMGTGGRGDIHPAGPETAATAPVGAGNV